LGVGQQLIGATVLSLRFLACADRKTDTHVARALPLTKHAVPT